MPSAPVTINVVDVAGTALTQDAFGSTQEESEPGFKFVSPRRLLPSCRAS
jgi:hypothetical protein